MLLFLASMEKDLIENFLHTKSMGIFSNAQGQIPRPVVGSG